MSVRSNERLWVAIRLTDLPLSALFPAGSFVGPVAVVHRKRVVSASADALAAGALFGLDATTAQVLSGCSVIDRDESREFAVVNQLMEELYRQFTPHIEGYTCNASAQKGLLLEVSSCLILFRGTVPLVDQLNHFMRRTGHSYTFGLGHTPRCAWLLSHQEYPVSGCESRQLFIERLHRLPINLFYDFPEAIESLAKTGFKTFGDLAAQIAGKSLSSFRKRLGAAFTDALCQTFAIDGFAQTSLFDQPRDAFRPSESFHSFVEFDYPVTVVDQLAPAIETLLHQLCDYLRKRQQQCQSIEWTISDIHRSKIAVPVTSDTPQSSWQLLYDLSIIQFGTRDLPFEVDTIALRCNLSTPMQTGSHALDFTQAQRRKRSDHDTTVMIAKLKARLGEDRVYKLGYKDSRIPESTNLILPVAESSCKKIPEAHFKALRPTWLLAKPVPIEARQERLYWQGFLTLLHGPERIIGPWWGIPVARDYYMALRNDNLRVWIFLDLYDKKWFAHGVFS